MRNKKGGSVPESFYKRSDAVVEVCGTLVDARGYEAGYDEAASDFGTYLNTD